MSFVNMGNTCYVSSVLQCLFSTHLLQKYIVKTTDSFKEFSEFKLAMIPYLNGSVINSTNILHKLNPIFLQQEQQDVVDFLLDILNCLRKNVQSLGNTLYKGNCKSNWCEDGKFNIIDEIFRYQKEITLTCEHCKHCISSFESDYIIHRNFQEENEKLLDYKCDLCKLTGFVERCVKYTHYPQVLILCNPSAMFMRWKCYRTYSICIHTTLDTNLGHYTSLIHNDNGWTYCNDEVKNRVDIHAFSSENIRLMFLCRSV